jgi:hypothetical protein
MTRSGPPTPSEIWDFGGPPDHTPRPSPRHYGQYGQRTRSGPPTPSEIWDFGGPPDHTPRPSPRHYGQYGQMTRSGLLKDLGVWETVSLEGATVTSGRTGAMTSPSSDICHQEVTLTKSIKAREPHAKNGTRRYGTTSSSGIHSSGSPSSCAPSLTAALDSPLPHPARGRPGQRDTRARRVAA